MQGISPGMCKVRNYILYTGMFHTSKPIYYSEMVFDLIRLIRNVIFTVDIFLIGG